MQVLWLASSRRVLRMTAKQRRTGRLSSGPGGAGGSAVAAKPKRAPAARRPRGAGRGARPVGMRIAGRNARVACSLRSLHSHFLACK